MRLSVRRKMDETNKGLLKDGAVRVLSFVGLVFWYLASED